MSTKTTFKRIALVAVAALGLGVLSVAPSNAAVLNLSATTVTVKDGTATTGTSDSRTAAEVTISFTGESSTDSASVTSYVSAKPTGASTPAQTDIVVHLVDTSTSTSAPTVGFRTDSVTVAALSLGATSVVRGDSATTIFAANATAFNAAKFKYYLLTASALSAGTYTITSVVTPYSNGVKGTAFTKDVNIVVTAADNNSTSQSTAHIGSATETVFGAETDTVAIVAPNTAKVASGDHIAIIKVTQRKATGSAANESLTAVITGPGTIGCSTSAGSGASAGRALTCATNGSGVVYVNIFGDGSSGKATIALTGATSGYAFATKSVLFSSTTIAKLTATVVNSVVATSGNSSTGAVSVVATDKDGNQIYNPSVYSNSSSTSVISNAYVSCAWDSTDLVSYCNLGAVAAGTANITVTNRASATATSPTTEVVSNAVSIRVGSTTPVTAKLSFDKGSYAPGEKATLTLTLLDKDGAAVAGSDLDNATYAAVWATGGISSNYAFYTGSDTTTATFANVKESTGLQTWTLYMPLQTADVTVTGTTGTKFAVANQAVKVTATVSVGNPAGVDAALDAANEATDAANAATDAALAAADAADAATAAAQDASDAVAALSAEVSKMIAGLKAQLTSLTNLIIKIQKKVKA